MKKFSPQKPVKEVISIRLPSGVLEQLDAKAAAHDISRNELINQCIIFALEHMGNNPEASANKTFTSASI